MKRLLCIILAAASLLCALPLLTSCGTKNPGGDGTSAGGTDDTTAAAVSEVEPAVEYPLFFFGELELSEQGDVTVDGTTFPGDPERDYRDEKQYTLHDSVSGLPDLCYNPLKAAIDGASLVFGYTTSRLYDRRLNESGDGWSIVPEMAAEMPRDVTSEYVGQFGIEEGDTKKAFAIKLNPDIKWADGTPIDADTYIYTYKQLLDPLQKNERADALIYGTLAVYGAKEHFYSGRSELVKVADSGFKVSDFLAEGYTYDELYLDIEGFRGVRLPDDTPEADAPFGLGFAKLSDETELTAPDGEVVTAKMLYETYLADGCEYEAYAPSYIYREYVYESGHKWDDVGIVKTDDGELVFVFTESVPQPEYDIPNGLFDYIVPEKLFESTKRYFDTDGDEVKKNGKNIIRVTSDYGTSPDKYMSCGPYSISETVADRRITFERSADWWGYEDGKHYGMYQTDTVDVRVIGDRAEALGEFLAGNIDSVGLSASEAVQYAASDRTVTVPDPYMMKLSFNCDLESLTARGTEILDNYNFRKAFTLALDRTSLASSLPGAWTAEVGLLNGTYISDPYTGGAYRDSDAAKQAIADLTGDEDGQSFDMEEAKRLMQLAYEQCVAIGTYEEGRQVELELCVFSADETNTCVFDFLKNALEAATEGTGFEGNVTLKMRESADFYALMRAGETDMTVATWGGPSENMFPILYRYCCDDAFGGGSQLEYGFETDKTIVSMTLDGHEFTQSLRDWARWAAGVTTLVSKDGELELRPFENYDADTKNAIFAMLEYAYLENRASATLCTRNSALLLSRKVDYGTEHYNGVTGFGGVQYMTYNYDDEAWEAVKAGITY